MKTVEFNEKGVGRWADTPSSPQFIITEEDVKAKKQYDVTDRTAEVIVEAGKGKIVNKKKAAPPQEDKEKSESSKGGKKAEKG